MSQPEKRNILNLVKREIGKHLEMKIKFCLLMIIDKGKAARGALGLKTEVVTLWLLTESWMMQLITRE